MAAFDEQAAKKHTGFLTIQVNNLCLYFPWELPLRVQAILGGPAITAGELAAGRGRGSNWFKEVQSKRLPDRATSGSAGAGKRIDSVNDDVDTLAKPGKRWGGLEDKVIRAAAAAIIAFLLAKIGL